MGIWTLDEFRAELGSSIGDRGVGNERLDRWINLAYCEVCGSIEFEGLKRFFDITVNEGLDEYDLPPNFLAFVVLSNLTSKKRLRKISQEDILKQLTDEDHYGSPEWWGRRDDKFYVYPVPDQDYELRGIYIKEPSRLAQSSCVTVIPATWDFTILLLAQHYAALSFGEVDKADRLFQRAIANMRSRKTDAEWMARSPTPGLQVAWTAEDLTDYGSGYE